MKSCEEKKSYQFLIASYVLKTLNDWYLSTIKPPKFSLEIYCHLEKPVHKGINHILPFLRKFCSSVFFFSPFLSSFLAVHSLRQNFGVLFGHGHLKPLGCSSAKSV